jgi:hypothetical protein
VWGAWGVQNGPSPIMYEPDAPQEGLMRGREDLRQDRLTALFFLLHTVERMLEPQLLPLDEDGPTEDLVCVV